jgi:hypothetical protein
MERLSACAGSFLTFIKKKIRSKLATKFRGKSFKLALLCVDVLSENNFQFCYVVFNSHMFNATEVQQ